LPKNTHQFDYLVIGSGLAGLTVALKASEHGKVAILSKLGSMESNSRYAQGGIAAVVSKDDTFEAHISDTLKAGAGLCHRDAVDVLVHEGPDRIKDLIDWGVEFSHGPSKSRTDFGLGREGGHSKRRVLHVGDFTGQDVVNHLLNRVRENPNIEQYESFIAVNLILDYGPSHKEVCGAYVLERDSGVVHTFVAQATILATGGAGKVYLYTTNPDIATGDGIALAYRAGADIANMEFYQFHPTCLYHPEAKNFLISEALRGEGGILKNKRGNAFMDERHPLKDLAPRDIVARAIDHELKETGEDCVFLDMGVNRPEFLIKRFPNIYKTCLHYGIDITRELIPVVPAAHYCCGGVVTDLNGKTSVNRLYGCGEVAHTGIHGANRLASNSLLECAVFGNRISNEIKNYLEKPLNFEIDDIPSWDSGHATDPDEMVIVSHNWDELRRLMWNYVGIVRSDKRLERALHRIEFLEEEIQQYYWDFKITSDLLELRNLITVAGLVVRSGLKRNESRGLHFNIDHPDNLDEPKDTVLRIID